MSVKANRLIGFCARILDRLCNDADANRMRRAHGAGQPTLKGSR